MIIAGMFISLSLGNEPVSGHPHELTWTVVATCAGLSAITVVILVVSLASGRRRAVVRD